MSNILDAGTQEGIYIHEIPKQTWVTLWKLCHIYTTYIYICHGFRSVTQVCFGISYACCLYKWAKAYWFSPMSLSKWIYIGVFSFRTLPLVWLWISSPSFSSTLLVYMERSLLIFRDVTNKIAAGRPYWIFQVPDSQTSISLALNMKPNFISTLPVCMGR